MLFAIGHDDRQFFAGQDQTSLYYHIYANYYLNNSATTVT